MIISWLCPVGWPADHRLAEFQVDEAPVSRRQAEQPAWKHRVGIGHRVLDGRIGRRAVRVGSSPSKFPPTHRNSRPRSIRPANRDFHGRADGMIFADDFIAMPPQCPTQWDGLAHAGAFGSASIRAISRSRTAGSRSRPFFFNIEEAVVGEASPQEERQARAEFEVADRMDRGERTLRGFFMHEQEVRRDQDGLQRDAGSGLKSAAGATLPGVDPDEGRKIGLGR